MANTAIRFDAFDESSTTRVRSFIARVAAAQLALTSLRAVRASCAAATRAANERARAVEDSSKESNLIAAFVMYARIIPKSVG